MRGFGRVRIGFWAAAVAAVAALVFVSSATANELAPAEGAPSKITNFSAWENRSPNWAEAVHASYMQTAFDAVPKGACEMRGPDGAYVNEMLVRFGEDGSKSYERRVALVIGNGAYESFDALDNPVNDATSVSRVLGALGFTVVRGSDLSTEATQECLNDFYKMADGADVALLYYAGHGIAIDGVNTLLPVNASFTDETRSAVTGDIPVDGILTEMRKRAASSLLFLDACRESLNRGFEAIRPNGGRGVTSGDDQTRTALNRPGDAGASTTKSLGGFYYVYAAAPGQLASDGATGSQHSPFTQAFLDNVATPGLLVQQLVSNITASVIRSAQGQVPFADGSLAGDIYFNGRLTAGELVTQSQSFASRSQRNLELGNREDASIAALKGLPATWPQAETARTYFSNAMARLSLSQEYDDLEIRSEYPLTSVEFNADNSQVITASNIWVQGRGYPVEPGNIRIFNAGTTELIGEITPMLTMERAYFSENSKFIIVIYATFFNYEQWFAVYNAETYEEIISVPCGGDHSTLSDPFEFVNEINQNDLSILKDAGLVHRKISIEMLMGRFFCQNEDIVFLRSSSFLPDYENIGGISLDEAGRYSVVLEYKDLARHRLHIFDVFDTEYHAELPAKKITAYNISPTGDSVAFAYENQLVRFFDTEEQELRRNIIALEGHPLRSFRFNQAGNGFLIVDENDITVWGLSFEEKVTAGIKIKKGLNVFDEYKTTKMLFQKSTSETVFRVSFDESGKKLAFIENGQPQVWDIDSGSLEQRFDTFNGLILKFDYKSGDDSVLVATFRDVRIFPSETKSEFTSTFQEGINYDAAFDKKNNLIVSSADGSVIIADPYNQSLVSKQSIGNPVASLRLSKDQKMIAAGWGDSFSGGISLWKANSIDKPIELAGHSMRVLGVDFSSNSKLLVSGSGGRIFSGRDYTARVWDVSSGSQLGIFDKFDDGYSGGWIYSANFHPENDGIILISCSCGRLVLWDWKNDVIVREYKGHTQPIFQANFDKSGTRIVSASADESIKVWDMQSGEMLLDIREFDAEFHSAVFTNSGDRIVASSGEISIWDARTGLLLNEISGHDDVVWRVAVSHDDSLIASASFDNSAKVWKMPLYGSSLIDEVKKRIDVSRLIEVERERIRYWELDEALLQ